MRKILMAGMAGMLFFTACDNEGSSTVGTYERPESASTEKEGGAKEEKEVDNKANPGKFYIDSSKSVNSSLRKKDAGASPEKNSPNMQSKAAQTATQPR